MQNRIFDIYIPAISGIIMLILLTIRFVQLKNTGHHQYRQYNATLKIRVFLLILCVLLTLTYNFVSILNPKFYLYKSDYSQIFMFMCIVYSTQVAGILHEYNKNVPIMFTHKIFWIICLITNIIQAILNGLNQLEYDILSNVVLYLIIVDQFSLNIFSFFIRKQDKIEFEGISGLGMTVPDYEDSRQNMIPIQNSFIGLSSTQSQFKCTIHFSKTWKIVQQKDGRIDAVITLKIFLSNPNKHYQLKKTINDFVMLESKLQQEDKFGFEIYKLPNDFFQHGPDTNQMFNEKITLIKIWLRQIISIVLEQKMFSIGESKYMGLIYIWHIQIKTKFLNQFQILNLRVKLNIYCQYQKIIIIIIRFHLVMVHFSPRLLLFLKYTKTSLSQCRNYKIEYLTPSIYDFLEFDDATRVCIIKDQRNKSNSLDQSN